MHILRNVGETLCPHCIHDTIALNMQRKLKVSPIGANADVRIITRITTNYYNMTVNISIKMSSYHLYISDSDSNADVQNNLWNLRGCLKKSHRIRN